MIEIAKILLADHYWFTRNLNPKEKNKWNSDDTISTSQIKN
jgi:hypothetical protein